MDGHLDFEASDEYLPDIVDKVLLLTRNELLFIDDNLSMLVEKDLGDSGLGTVRPLAHTAGLPAPIELLEKIGKGLLFVADPKNTGKEAHIPVSDTDLYMLREVALSYAKVGTEHVGFNLKVKIYTQLFAKDYERDKIADTLLSQVDTSPKVLGPEDNNS
tara:strand:- start:1521 stop:2000 length:480 start_codon:yes stop_codon:yes gene_type:complete